MTREIEFTPGEEDPSQAVLRALNPDTSPTTPPIYEQVDLDALDAIYDSIAEGGSVSFRYGGSEVVVEPPGVVRVEDAE